MSTAVATAGRWSREHDACVLCGGIDAPHQGSGVCKKCYQAKWTVHKRAMLRAKARQREQGGKTTMNEANGATKRVAVTIAGTAREVAYTETPPVPAPVLPPTANIGARAPLVALTPTPVQSPPAPPSPAAVEPTKPAPPLAPMLRPRHVTTISTYQIRCPNCGDFLTNAARHTASFRADDLAVGTELACGVCDARWRIGKDTLPGGQA